MRVGIRAWASPSARRAGPIRGSSGLPACERLPWYAEHFDAVEVNSTFYAVPAAATVERWAEQTPAGFTFDVKLRNALAEAVLESVQPLVGAGKLASFPLQLSPGFAPHCNQLDELAPLLERLAPHPVAVELRRDSWMREKRAEETLKWIEAHGAAWVCVDVPDADHVTIMPPLDVVTNPRLAYLRAHGRNAEGYIRRRSVAERFKALLSPAVAR